MDAMIAPNQFTALDIRVITEPTVYLLGRQTVDQAELDRFLRDHGVSWQSDSEVAAEPDRTARRKAARQAARSVLPNATETKIFVTANGRALRHFLEQRGSRHAEPEIRKLANRLLDLLQRESPNLFSDYTREPLPD